MTAILALLKLVPLKDWLYIGAGLALTVGLLAYNSHERGIGRAEGAGEVCKTLNIKVADGETCPDKIRQTIADVQSQLALAQAANASAGTAIKALESKLAECEKGRVVDKAAQDEAQKAYAAAIGQFKAGDAAQRARTTKLLQGDCLRWSQEPACGVSVP